MTQQEADKIVMGMGCHPYSRLAMIDALLEGEKIGKREQKAIDLSMFQSFLSERGLLYGKYTKANGDTGYKTLDELWDYFNKATED